MRLIILILSLLMATQPMLVAVANSECGSARCEASTLQESRCSGCPGCPSSSVQHACCCAPEPREPTRPLQNSDPKAEVLLALAEFDTTNPILVVAETSDDVDSNPEPVPANNLTHNERLALRCIRQT